MYHGIRDERHEVAFQDTMRCYDVKHILDFDPTRKRMSVIIQDDKKNYYLFVKGECS